MQHNEFPKGSTWLKCDLHIHTPKSVENQYKGGDSEEGWEEFITDLERLPKEFRIVGINDYLFVDGYKKVLWYKNDKKRLSNIDLVLPIVEFRICKFGGVEELRHINFHIIFADNAALPVEVLEQQFLNSLSAEVRLHPERQKQWNGIINRESLTHFGKSIKQSMPADKVPNISDIRYGFNNLTFDENKILQMLNRHFFHKNGKPLFLTAIGKTEWDAMRWDAAIADKKDLINKVNFVFCASPSVDQYNTNKAKLREQGVNNRLLHCSDAHFLSTDDSAPTNMKIGHCFTWIKANSTFEGLRQIVYEFDSRVHTGLVPPASKKPYHVIDKVAFVDNTGSDKFQPTPIHLNPNLNTIIGGKSTGKSLLLNHIAKTIDRKEFLSRKPQIAEYSHEKNPDFDFRVTWADGVEDTLKGNNNSRRIVYLSQNFIDNLTNENFENRLALNEFIAKILLQNEEASKYDEESVQKIRNYQSTISKEIIKLFEQIEKLEEVEQEIRDFGDFQGIVAYIRSLKSQIDELKAEGLSQNESEKYETLASQVKALNDSIADVEKDKERLDDYFNDLREVSVHINLRSNFAQSLNDDSIKSRFLAEFQFLDDFGSRLNSAYNNVSNFIESIISAKQSELQKVDSDLKPLSMKSRRADELLVKYDELRVEEDKLRKIEALNNSIQEQKQQLRDTVSTVLLVYDEMLNQHAEIAKKFKEFTELSSDLSIDIRVGFNESLFNKRLEQSNINKPSLKKAFPKHHNDLGEFYFCFDRNQHRSDIQKFFNETLTDVITINKGGSKRQAIEAILSDYFFLDYSITYQNDPLDIMSPGKKNIVMLKILIELSNAECPILIDQPEDDLDNRSIYVDLVKFLETKKNERQVITVTHNPNVVIGSDAEEIIVANQEGQIKGRENVKYKFEYVTGAIENSFTNFTADGVLFKLGIREHICDILEGGAKAFQERERRYSFPDISEPEQGESS